MTVGGVGAAVPPPGGEEARLRQAARQLEGVFVEQLFKAMRETVPREGVVDGGSGEEMFTGMLDQHLAGALPETWGDGGIADALYRQLRGAIDATGAPQAATDATGKVKP